jgi:hypothetical protein
MNMRILRLAAVFGFCCGIAFADAVAEPTITPVQAELMADLHARLLKPGQTVYARVTVDWRSADCTLRNGAILEGHVLSVVPRSKATRDSEVDLAFTKAQCGDAEMGSFALLLAAMAAPPQNSDLGMLSEAMPVSTSGTGGISALKSMPLITVNLEVQIYQFPLVPHLQMGYVSGMGGLKLSVGTGANNSSVLTAKNHDVSLEKHTLLLLVPAQGTFPREASRPSESASAVASAGGGASAVRTPAPSAPPPVPDIDVCAPPECNLALQSGGSSEGSKAAASISVRELGYAARPQKAMESFDHDEALAYLGPRELLVAFNPHNLVPRHTLGRAGSTVRVIRAAVVDTETHRVTHTADWELPDDRQFLWPLPESRVLVHLGSELRVYGEGLKIQNRMALDGPLAFVRVTPDGNFIAAGVIRERHTAELHAQLRETLNTDPEEDVNILVLNRNFETIARSTTRSGLIAPTLLNEGQATLRALPNKRYRIWMQTWDNHSSVIASFSSSCTPELASIAPDLMFLVSCNRQTEGREYRVLRPDGKLALKGDSMLNEGGHAAAGNVNPEAFVVKVVQSSMPMRPGVPFSANEFSSEELGVYRASDGKRLLNVRVGSPSASRDGYALAPDGSQLAVLTRDHIAVYAVHEK